MKAIVAAAALFTAGVNAHAIFQQLYVNGVSQGHLTGIRVPDYDGPIMDVDSNDIICNGGVNPFHTPLPNTTITIPAGAQVTTEWHHDLTGANPSDTADPIDISHKGPVLTYLARIPNAQQSDVTGLKWFKIYHDGLIADTQQWAVDRLYANKGKVTFTIPSCIPAGQYLLRNEIIALHSAVSYPGAQFYVECAQIQITGGGSTSPPTVSFPGAYKGADPGITTNIYWPILTNYTIPGPDVFTCNGAGTPPQTSTVKSTTVASPTSTTPAPPSSTIKSTTSAPATTAPSTGGTVAQWGQCGGQGYTGPTQCVSGFTCTVLNAFFFQCI